MASNKFEKLIEYVVANDEKKARQLFHKIVVEKSRKIYEDLDIEDNSRAFDEVESDETSLDDAAGPVDEFGGDEVDDLEHDTFSEEGDEDFGEGLPTDDEFGAEGELTPEVDDRLADLESSFDELKAEFEALLGDEEKTDEDIIDKNEDEEEDIEIEDENLEDDEEAEEDLESDDLESEDLDSDEKEEDEDEEEEKVEEDEPVDESVIREYVDKVTKGLANTTEEPSTNKKSVVAGKNPLGAGSASPKNIVAGGTEKGRTAPTSGKFTTEPIVNVPGGKAKLKPVAKPVTTKEAEGTNKKSNLS